MTSSGVVKEKKIPLEQPDNHIGKQTNKQKTSLSSTTASYQNTKFEVNHNT
jgi:hypothetical protein